MCTAISLHGRHALSGRTLDLEYSFGERAVIIPRKFKHKFRRACLPAGSYAIMGIAHIAGGVPLFYDAMNENGLYAAALNFPRRAVYSDYKEGVINLASFEVIPYILSSSKSIDDAEDMFRRVNIVGDSFSPDLPATPLHWFFSDGARSIVCEPLGEGLKIYGNPSGVMTNSPELPYHILNLSNYMRCSPEPPKNSLCPNLALENYSRGLGGIGLPGDYSSESRFVRAAFAKTHTVCESSGEISSFFHIMDTVSVPRGCILTDEGLPVSTVYTSCADLSSGEYFFTTYENRRVRKISFKNRELDSSLPTIYPIYSAEDIYEYE